MWDKISELKRRASASDTIARLGASTMALVLLIFAILLGTALTNVYRGHPAGGEHPAAPTTKTWTQAE